MGGIGYRRYSSLPKSDASFYRTSSGSEIDLILEKGDKRAAAECKCRSLRESCGDLLPLNIRRFKFEEFLLRKGESRSDDV